MVNAGIAYRVPNKDGSQTQDSGFENSNRSNPGLFPYRIIKNGIFVNNV